MTTTTAPTSGAYPIDLTFDQEHRIGRVWGIPLLGVGIRYVLLIPHLIILGVLGLVASLLSLVTWIPVVLTGRFPDWGYDIIGGTARWYLRITAYLYLMAGPYPPFRMEAGGYPVDLVIDRSTRINRLWGFPVLGIMLRAVLVIPHLILLWILGLVAGFILFFAWIPVLLYGRFPALGYDLVGGYLRLSTRVAAWVLLMAGPYPPFGLR